MTHKRSLIKFGTDGWRAIIGDGFTLDNLERVSRATAEWVLETYGEGSSVLIGYDTRFRGRDFTLHVARVMASMGVKVVVSDTHAPTPAVSWGTKHFGHQAGIVITASHNPPEYSGFKIKADFGGPALPDMIADVERRIQPFEERGYEELSTYMDRGMIAEQALRSEYIRHVASLVDIDAIRNAGITVVHDAMFGAGQGILSELMGADRVVEHRNTVNPGFEGTPPEPIERNLNALRDMITSKGCDAAIANDGDADRIGMADEHGDFVDSHHLLALLVDYLHNDKGLSGRIVKTFSTTNMLDKMAAEMGLALSTTKIGFKYIGGEFLAGDVLVGGEESGGMAVMGHVPERDGIFIGLVILEMMAKRGKQLSRLVQDLHDRYGKHAFTRNDKHTSPERKEAILIRLAEHGGISEVADKPVTKAETIDGFKYHTEDGWLLVRPSGTEPVLRIYAEASSSETSDRMVADAISQLGL
ncbi:MAG: phosphoglucomutase/phosphomannomutase family protein [Rhodothermales bacterium]